MPPERAPEPRTPTGLRRTTFRAMGTEVVLLLPIGADAEPWAMRRLFERWEAALSRFRPESELSRLNRRAGRVQPVSPLMAEVLAAALRAARDSDGLYDPGLGAQIARVGYDRSFADLPDGLPPARGPAHGGGGWRAIALDRERGTVLLPAGLRLDLGGIAKGMAVDAAAHRLRAGGMPSGLVGAGGDLVVWGLPPGRGAWPVLIRTPAGGVVAPLRSGALATSGVARRRWRQGAEERHHLIDPRTGEPARAALWSVSVVAPTCRAAEVAAKAAFVLGPGPGAALLEARGLDALMVDAQGAPRAVGGWPLDARTAA